MNGSPQQLVRALVGTALIAAMLPVQAATIRAGSGASPPAYATGVYEIAVVKDDAGRLQRMLALVHRGTLQELHSRGSVGYLRRATGSTPIRVSPGTYVKLLALAGGLNRDVNSLPLATRCEYYALARLSTTEMNCPSGTVWPRTTYDGVTSQDVCPPPDHELVFTTDAYGRPVPQCVRKTETGLPALPGRFSSSLFNRPIAFVYAGPAVTRAAYGASAFAGFYLLIGWLDEEP